MHTARVRLIRRYVVLIATLIVLHRALIVLKGARVIADAGRVGSRVTCRLSKVLLHGSKVTLNSGDVRAESLLVLRQRRTVAGDTAFVGAYVLGSVRNRLLLPRLSGSRCSGRLLSRRGSLLGGGSLIGLVLKR